MLVFRDDLHDPAQYGFDKDDLDEANQFLAASNAPINMLCSRYVTFVDFTASTLPIMRSRVLPGG